MERQGDEIWLSKAAAPYNNVGVVTLAAALEALARIGMAVIAEHEHVLTEFLVRDLLGIPTLRLYGSTAPADQPRIGVASFNIAALEHGFTAAVLNDYFCIAVRNGCFCAQPYVRALLAPELWGLDVPEDHADAERLVSRRRGMVRVRALRCTRRRKTSAP